MTSYLDQLKESFVAFSNSTRALEQAAYMRNNFAFLGINSPDRKDLQKPFLLKQNLPTKKEAFVIVKQLWQLPEREYQYFALELALKYLNELKEDDINLFEWLVIHKSWWDTVDVIAPKLMGPYFQKFPQNRNKIISAFIASNNLWLQRSAILFQLKYKQKVDTHFLSFTIQSLLGSKQFFINKAIGWMLREYSRTDANWVLHFAQQNNLSNLSKKEALRLILK